MLPTPGQIVRARSRQYLVEQVVEAPAPGDDTLVRLACLDDDAQGEPLDVLWERELDTEIVTPSSFGRAIERGFDPPTTFAAYLATMRWGCVTATNPRLLQAPYRAGIDVTAYQLEPLRKALQLPFVNLFIADDVGLGKTIEAGLVMRELMLRQKVRRVVVACPPSVVLQWRDELERRFGLRFVIYDRDFVLEKRRERGFGVNPFTTHTRFVISHALLRDEAHASLLRDWITNDDHLRADLREPALFVLDEAHNAAPASASKYAIDSKLTRAVRELARLFEHRLFLSATPHNGHSNSFSALLEILDPHRFCRGVKPSPRHLDAVMVRRLKGDLAEVGLDFPNRRPIQVDIGGLPDSAPELELTRLLDEYREVREAKVKDSSKRKRAAALIVLTSLQKRLLSSTEAFACTLRVHKAAALRGSDQDRTERAFAEAPLPSLDPPSADDDEAEAPEAQTLADQEGAVEAATVQALAPGELEAREVQLLERMTDIAERARGAADKRIEHLVAWIKENCLDPDGRTWRQVDPDDWSAVRRVLIFTEYADTKRYIDEQLRSALARTDRADERVGTFHGGMDDERREAIKTAFNGDLESHPLRILIATDAAREGVNLQNHCADLFHFDVPWNPSRMEQRNGRIDRKLQRAKEVRCYYFVHTQRPEDHVLATLVRKTKTIHTELGSLAQVLEARLSRMLEGGIRRRDAEGLVRSIDGAEVDAEQRATVDEELEASSRARRDRLVQQISGLRDVMAAAQEALAFDTAKFRRALDASLEMLGAKELQAAPEPTGAWQLPRDDTRLTGDPSWAETLDTLRKPRQRDEKLWAWRKDSPLRPIVFADVGSLDEKTVHVHLEHRFAQRLLSRFTAQGFVHDDLSRVCAVSSSDPIPRVVLLGRLSLYGEGAARLHDELIATAARWVDPALRREPLSPYTDETKQKSLELVERALAEPRPVPEAGARLIKASLLRDAEELVRPLIDLGEERARRAEGLLRTRGEREAKELEEVLTAQQKKIRDRVEKSDSPQLTLGFDDDERKQLEADRRHWVKRLGELDGDLATEPPRIRSSYDVRARRVDPLGIVYLWPSTG